MLNGGNYVSISFTVMCALLNDIIELEYDTLSYRSSSEVP